MGRTRRPSKDSSLRGSGRAGVELAATNSGSAGAGDRAPDPRRISPTPFIWDALVRLAPRDGTVVDVGCGAAPDRPAFTARYIGVDITDEPYREGVPRTSNLPAVASCAPPFLSRLGSPSRSQWEPSASCAIRDWC